MLDKLGKYRIDGVLGTGAMGVVYKAFDTNIERTVALKTIRAELFGDHADGDLYARFKNEAQASGRLSHPSIVAVYDFGEIDQIAYLAMEYVQGTPLNALLVAGVPTDIDASVSCLSQLLRALDYAHARGVVHRDVKPANLIITDDALVKITDFGIARIESSTLTQTGSVIGTPSYMAPEQFRGETADGRTDVFAAGIVLYQLLTGGRPFVGSASTVMHQILNETPPNPSGKNAALGPEFDVVVQKALAKNPADRYASAQAFLEALQGAHRVHKSRLGANTSAEDDNERTVMAFRARAAGVAAAAPGQVDPGYTPTSPGSSAINTTTPWKVEMLPELQTLLSLQVGPMARLLLKNAAGGAANIDELCDKLLPHIPSEKGRAQFLDGVGGLRKKLASSTGNTGGAGTSRTGGAALATGLGGATAMKTSMTGITLAPDILELAEEKLTPYIGPIARVIVKKVAKQTADRREFFLLLAANLPTAEERARFLREVGAG